MEDFADVEDEHYQQPESGRVKETADVNAMAHGAVFNYTPRVNGDDPLGLLQFASEGLRQVQNRQILQRPLERMVLAASKRYEPDAVPTQSPQAKVSGEAGAEMKQESLYAEAKQQVPLYEAARSHSPSLNIGNLLSRMECGEKIDFHGYTLRKKIDNGSSFEVVEAKRDGETYVLKFPRDDESRGALERHADAIESVSHKNVVPLIERGDGYVVEPYCGLPLRSAMQKGILSAWMILEQGDLILDALHAVHRAGVVHGDLKPENILFDGLYMSYLTDFGAAIRPEIQGSINTQVQCTRGYAAPEQLRGKSDHRSDLYSTAVVLFEMLTGHIPEGSAVRIEDYGVSCIKSTDFFRKALHPNPDKRYQTALEMRAALARMTLQLTQTGHVELEKIEGAPVCIDIGKLTLDCHDELMRTTRMKREYVESLKIIIAEEGPKRVDNVLKAIRAYRPFVYASLFRRGYSSIDKISPDREEKMKSFAKTFGLTSFSIAGLSGLVASGAPYLSFGIGLAGLGLLSLGWIKHRNGTAIARQREEVEKILEKHPLIVNSFFRTHRHIFEAEIEAYEREHQSSE